jgi:hypothetical protein
MNSQLYEAPPALLKIVCPTLIEAEERHRKDAVNSVLGFLSKYATPGSFT